MSTPREPVRSVPCTECGAGAGRWCRRVNGHPRAANHMPRIIAYRRVVESDGSAHLTTEGVA